LLRTVLSDLGKLNRVFFTILYECHTRHIYIYIILLRVSLTLSVNKKKHSGQFYIFVPSVSLVLSLSIKLLRIVFIDSFSTEGDTQHNSLLSSNL
jgi:general stress protein CsbA